MRLREAALPLALTATFAAGCTSAETNPAAPSESVSASIPETSTTAPLPEHCPTPSAEVLNKVRDLIDQPAAKETDPISYLDQSMEPAAYRNLLQDFRASTAKDLGLEYHNGEVVRDEMLEGFAGDKEDPRPFDTFLARAQDFAKPYGVDITVATPDNPGLADGAHAPSASELSTHKAKRDMASIVEALGDQTVEYHKTSGLKHVVLMAGAKAEVTESGQSGSKKGDVEGYVHLNTPDTMYLNIGNEFSPHTFLHEEQHERNAAQCGERETMRDPGFKAINGPYNAVTFDPKDAYQGDYFKTSSDQLNNMQFAEVQHDKKRYCAAMAARVAAGRNLKYETSYHPNTAEDDAELAASTVSDGLYAVTEKGVEESPLRKKTELLLARDALQNPKVVEFITRTSSRAIPLTQYKC
jgi:hypothetical protein